MVGRVSPRAGAKGEYGLTTAREDARPTNDAAPTRLGNGVARVATKISLLTELLPTPMDL